MKLIIYISALLLAYPAVNVSAVPAGAIVPDESIVEHIENSGNISVNMPYALRKRIERDNTVVPVVDEPKTTAPVSGKMGGYRIQVFSDNNARTAKAEARTRARNVSARFPELATYVVFNSPYWRLKVGNFRTQDEAENTAHMLKEAFPAYSREIRVVRDRIVVGE